MTLNNFKCNHLMPLHFKGLNRLCSLHAPAATFTILSLWQLACLWRHSTAAVAMVTCIFIL